MSSSHLPSRPHSSTTGGRFTVDRTSDSGDDPFEYLGCCNCYRDLVSHGKKPNKKRASTTFWLLQCGHLSCAVCLGYEKGQPNPEDDHQCPMPTCASSKSAIHEMKTNEPIHPSIASYLIPHQVLTNQLASVWAFQFEQMSLRIQNLRKRGDIQRQTLENAVSQLQSLRSLRKEFADLKAINHQLQIELDHARTAPSHPHQTSVSNRKNPVNHETRPQQFSSRQQPNLSHKRTVSLGENLERPAQRIKRPQSSQVGNALHPGQRGPHALPGLDQDLRSSREALNPPRDPNRLNAHDQLERPPSVGLTAVQKGLKQFTYDATRPPSRTTERSAPQESDRGSHHFKLPALGVIPENTREENRYPERTDLAAPDTRHQVRQQEPRRPLSALTPRASGGHFTRLGRPPSPQERLPRSRQDPIAPLSIPPRNVPRSRHLPNALPNQHQLTIPNQFLPHPPAARSSNLPGFTYHPESNGQTADEDMTEKTTGRLPPSTPSRYAYGRGESRAEAPSVASYTRFPGSQAAQPISSASVLNNGLGTPRFGPARGAQ